VRTGISWNFIWGWWSVHTSRLSLVKTNKRKRCEKRILKTPGLGFTLKFFGLNLSLDIIRSEKGLLVSHACGVWNSSENKSVGAVHSVAQTLCDALDMRQNPWGCKCSLLHLIHAVYILPPLDNTNKYVLLFGALEPWFWLHSSSTSLWSTLNLLLQIADAPVTTLIMSPTLAEFGEIQMYTALSVQICLLAGWSALIHISVMHITACSHKSVFFSCTIVSAYFSVHYYTSTVGSCLG